MAVQGGRRCTAKFFSGRASRRCAERANQCNQRRRSGRLRRRAQEYRGVRIHGTRLRSVTNRQPVCGAAAISPAGARLPTAARSWRDPKKRAVARGGMAPFGPYLLELARAATRRRTVPSRRRADPLHGGRRGGRSVLGRGALRGAA